MAGRIRVSIPSDPDDLIVVDAVVERFGTLHGLDRQEMTTLRWVVGELGEFLLARAYPNNPTGELAVQLEMAESAVRVLLEDWGAPIAAFGGGLGGIPEELGAVEELTGDLRLVNLGADGKRLSATVPAEGASPAVLPAFGDVVRAAEPGDETADDVRVRDTQRQDVEAISRLLFENYGLSYGHPDFYRPTWLAEQIASGHVRSTVAILGGEVVGHHALLVEGEATCGETGIAVVHPAYRGLGIFGRLFQHTVERARAADLDAVYGSAVTSHPYSQRAERARGYRETALLLGSVPAAVHSKGVGDEDEGPPRRGASLITFLPLGDGRRAVSLPERHAPALRAAYDLLGLAVADPDPAGAATATAQGPAVTSTADATRASGVLSVHRWEEGTHAELIHELRALLGRGQDVVYCDLSLHAMTAEDLDEALDLLAARDFFLAGLMPFGPHGHDRLRLQCLISDEIELERIVLDSDDAQALHAAVMADRDLVLGD